MSNKTAFITDIHFGVRGSSLYFVERYKLFFENVFFPQCIKNGVKKIFVLGSFSPIFCPFKSSMGLLLTTTEIL